MYNPPHFSIVDTDWSARLHPAEPVRDTRIRHRRRGALCLCARRAGLEPAPLGAVCFHLARNNPIAGVADGAAVKIGIMGAHAYVSPDWYETPDQVPTWNYMAIEGCGATAAARLMPTR